MDITTILVGLIMILGGVFVLFIKPNISMKLSTDQINFLKGLAQTAVFAAEKLFGAKMGEDKKAYAMNYVKTLLAKYNLTFDEDIISAEIEAQVQQLGLDIQAVSKNESGS